MNSERPDIKYLFEPRGIAVIGVSHDRTKIGYKIFENLVLCGYKGDLYPINPKGGELLGKKVYPSLSEVNGTIDVALIAVPSQYVYDSSVECSKKGVKFLVIITSGFSEVGKVEEERKIVKLAKDNNMRVLGPNIFGLYSAPSSMNGTFGSKDVLPGRVGIITQSGALGIAMIGRTAIEGIGLSAMVSVGNKSDIDESDLLEYLSTNDLTKIILMYIEGVQNGERFIETLRKVTKRKPVIVIKSGRSKRGALAAASHTGSLAGSDEVFEKIMKQVGVMRADTLEEAFNWCKFISSSPMPKGENTVIVTNGGGIGVMATDACEKFGVNMMDDIPLLSTVFRDVTPEFGSMKNPIDITGQAKSRDYDLAIGAGLEVGEIDSVIALYCETAVFDIENLVSMVEDNYRKYSKKGKPIVFSLIGGARVEKAINELKSRGVPVFDDVYDAVQVMGALYKFYRHLNEVEEPFVEYPMEKAPIDALIGIVRKDDRTFLLANEAHELMKITGIPMPVSIIAKNIEEAVQNARSIGYPVVMKVVSKDIIHKSDAGGVALDLENDEEAMDAYQAIMRSCRKYDPNAKIEGVEVCEMVRKGTENIIGARVDKSFGPIMMFGMGGIYVEVLKDVSFRALPLDRREVLRMIKDTRAYPLLLGVRGEEKKDIDMVIEIILKLGSLLRQCREISDIEINPLVAYEDGKGAKAVDVRILLTKETVVS